MVRDDFATFTKIVSKISPARPLDHEAMESTANKIMPILAAFTDSPRREELATLDYMAVARKVIILESSSSGKNISDEALVLLFEDSTYLERLVELLKPIAALVFECLEAVAMERDLATFDMNIDQELRKLLGQELD